MAQPDVKSPAEPPSQAPNFKLLRKLFGRQNGAPEPAGPPPEPDQDRNHEPGHGDDEYNADKPGWIRRSRNVVPGLPRAQTFKRQMSEKRNNLAPVQPTSAERRAVSEDRRALLSRATSQTQSHPRASAPDFLDNEYAVGQSVGSLPASPVDGPAEDDHGLDAFMSREIDHAAPSTADAHSITTSQYDAVIHNELESTWILNLSMHFRDKSKREKFFVTYRERDTLWRRVTISLDYRNAPDGSLEQELLQTKFQREKSAKIYEAIRESLQDIQFYETVTNLKLQTTDGRLHVHVVEDVNEIVHFPTVRQIQHLGCRRVREQDIQFDSHMSGFVYKVNVNGAVLIKKEIPGPDTIDEFLYEINALSRLQYSENVIHFYGVVVDDNDEYVKGLLISFAEQGALIDVLFDSLQEGGQSIPWPVRQRWAQQIVQGLSDIHEAGFVQGDFTLSNIVIDEYEDAKIIDINRRGCPVGWEPPEATALIECGQRISMYIGVKSDLYQLGMVLWALAMEDDEPEGHGRPLVLGPDVRIPDWYRRMVEVCLSEDPRYRPQAASLIPMFPESLESRDRPAAPSISVDDTYSLYVDGYRGAGPQIRTVEPSSDWSYVNLGPNFSGPPATYQNEPYHYTRGRSPPSPLPSNDGRFGSSGGHGLGAWRAYQDIAPSYSDVGHDEIAYSRSATPTTNKESVPAADMVDSLTMRLQLEEGRQGPVTTADAHVGHFTNENLGIEPEQHKPATARDHELMNTYHDVPTVTTETSKIEEQKDPKRSGAGEEAGTTAPAAHATKPEATLATASPPGDESAPPHRQGAGESTTGAEPGTTDRAGSDARDTTPRPPSRPTPTGSPAGDLPELKGVGGAYGDAGPEEREAQITIDEELDAAPDEGGTAL